MDKIIVAKGLNQNDDDMNTQDISVPDTCYTCWNVHMYVQSAAKISVAMMVKRWIGYFVPHCLKTENDINDKISFKIINFTFYQTLNTGNQLKKWKCIWKKVSHCCFGNYKKSSYSWHREVPRWFMQYSESCNECDKGWFQRLKISEGILKQYIRNHNSHYALRICLEF